LVVVVTSHTCFWEGAMGQRVLGWTNALSPNTCTLHHLSCSEQDEGPPRVSDAPSPEGTWPQVWARASWEHSWCRGLGPQILEVGHCGSEGARAGPGTASLCGPWLPFLRLTPTKVPASSGATPLPPAGPHPPCPWWPLQRVLHLEDSQGFASGP
jgi:hypothetical protein